MLLFVVKHSFYSNFSKHNMVLLGMKRHIFYNTQDSRSCMFTLKQMCKSQDHTFGYFYRFGIFTTASYLLYMVLMVHFRNKKLHTYTHRQYHFSFFSSFVFLQMFINIGSGNRLNEHTFVLKLMVYL